MGGGFGGRASLCTDKMGPRYVQSPAEGKGPRHTPPGQTLEERDPTTLPQARPWRCPGWCSRLADSGAYPAYPEHRCLQ